MKPRKQKFPEKLDRAIAHIFPCKDPELVKDAEKVRKYYQRIIGTAATHGISNPRRVSYKISPITKYVYFYFKQI